jgi:hypothetical protein
MPDYIWIVSPPGYPHSECFAEVAESLSEKLRIPIARSCTGPNALILAPHLLPRMQTGGILYNFEQIVVDSPIMTGDYLHLLRTHPVWDYSQSNIRALAALGITAAYAPVTYTPCLTRIQPAPVHDVDVLFYGSLNERRRAVLSQCRDRGLKVQVLFGVYGTQRDAWIARSKIVLNVHFYSSRLFEIVRMSYLLANQVPVVCETGIDDQFLEGICFAEYQELADACQRLVSDEGARRQLAQQGFRLFRATQDET